MNDQKPKKVGAGFGLILLRENEGKKEVLFGKRHDDPEKASSALHGEGTWTLPGGKLDFGESFENGAARELLEETSIMALPENIKVISLSNEIVPDAHFVTIGMVCEKYDGEPQVMEPDEITEWKWFNLDNLPSKLFVPSVNLLRNYKGGIFYTR